MRPLRDDLEEWFDAALPRSSAFRGAPRVEEIGVVSRIGDGVALVAGLPEARLDELLRFGAEEYGMAVTLERERIGCVLLSTQGDIRAGSKVERTGEVVRVPVGENLLGRVIDPLGRPVDEGPPLDAKRRDPIDKPAPAIIDRDPVTRPLETGITVIDAMIPLGRGQRELVIGDRKTGKSALAVDTILNQKRSDVICVYVAVGQRASSINQVIDAVRRHGAPERTIFVVAEADSAAGLQWIAPYAACTMAEYFSESGREALLVIDDLTKHAAVYRQISLLLRRPPGREAYPGDIFYIHARLLERAAKLSAERGGGSLTALPIAETQAGNLTAYIPTNLISITDGQIYLDPKLFYEAQKPAIDVGKSVSRVGGKAQTPIMKELSGRLRLEYAQFLELEVFTRFGATVDERTRKAIEHGRRIRSILVQPQLAPLRPAEEVALLLALDAGVLDELSLEGVERFKSRLGPWLEERCADLLVRIEARGELAEGEHSLLVGELGGLAKIAARPEPSTERG